MKVRVWNTNIHPYKEKFRDQLVTIEPNQYIEMDEDEADYFMQTYCFPKKDSQGRPDPLYFKKLKLEVPPEVAQARREREDLVCHANGQRASSAKELAEILNSFSHMRAEKDVDGEVEATLAKNKALAKENKALKSRLDLIEEKLGLKADLPNEKTV